MVSGGHVNACSLIGITSSQAEKCMKEGMVTFLSN